MSFSDSISSSKRSYRSNHSSSEEEDDNSSQYAGSSSNDSLENDQLSNGEAEIDNLEDMMRWYKIITVNEQESEEYSPAKATTNNSLNTPNNSLSDD